MYYNLLLANMAYILTDNEEIRKKLYKDKTSVKYEELINIILKEKENIPRDKFIFNAGIAYQFTITEIDWMSELNWLDKENNGFGRFIQFILGKE